MPGTLELEDDRIYSESVICRSLGLSASVLTKARRDGGLRSLKAGRRRIYLGRWIKSWLESAGEPRQREVAAC